MDCRNCHTQLIENQNYCSECGGKVIETRITLKHIFHQFNEQFLSIDNKLLKTFYHLIIRPKEVIDGFIYGVRNRHVNVISYLALALTMYGFQFFVLKKFFSESFVPNSTDYGSAAMNDELAREINEGVLEYMGLITIILIPAVALITYFIFRKRQYNYAEHIVLNTYIIAQYTIMTFFLFFILMLFGLDVQLNFVIGAIFCYAYMGYVLKKLFELSFFGTLWRLLLTIFLYAVTTIVLMIMAGIVFGIILALQK